MLEPEYELKLDRKAVKRNLTDLIDMGFDVGYSERTRKTKSGEDESVKPMKKVNGLKNGLDLPKHMAEHIYMYCSESVKVKFRADKI